MSIHKLSAGSGYDYLTRQVAALDATEKGHVGLASYYTERGETPGAWIGSGMAGIDGLSAGDPVTAEQMRALFGADMHPLAAIRLDQLAAADFTDITFGQPSSWARRLRFTPAMSVPSAVEVARRIATRHGVAGQLGNNPVSAGRRSTWQSWHVRAEAQRHVRAAEIATDKVDQLVDLLVAEVLQTRSISIARPDDGIREPETLRRADGSSVYTVAGSDLFTSARILAAEQWLVAAAGRSDGRILDAGTVELALLESAANGNALDEGQTALVGCMSTSGARLQLAIAPAGAGKTTAMRTLVQAWTDSGGTVVGLAPSAAAAAQLRNATGAPAETLAKLTWSIHGELPDWAERIGRSTLVIIDEAGMADTLSLDTAVQFIIGRGGSIRLVGDDQQLAAIGAGGVLRDIQASHGALR
jgi:hypothetical protein